MAAVVDLHRPPGVIVVRGLGYGVICQHATKMWQHTLIKSQKQELVDILEQLKACLEMQCDGIVAINQHYLHELLGCLRNTAL